MRTGQKLVLSTGVICSHLRVPYADGCNNMEHDYDGDDCKGGFDDIELKDDNELNHEDCPGSWCVACLLVRGLKISRSLLLSDIDDRIGNGHCDAICNTPFHNFDGGDCTAQDGAYASDSSMASQSAPPAIFSLLDILSQHESCNPEWCDATDHCPTPNCSVLLSCQL